MGTGQGHGFTPGPSANADYSSTAKPFLDTFLAKTYQSTLENIKHMTLRPTRFDIESFISTDAVSDSARPQALQRR